MVVVTDEVRTYAIFIYEWMGWTTHTEAGGDSTVMKVVQLVRDLECS